MENQIKFDVKYFKIEDSSADPQNAEHNSDDQLVYAQVEVNLTR